MAVRIEFPKLRQKVGDDGLLDLHDMLDETSDKWKKDVVKTVTDRYERRLTEEIGSLRSEMVREFSAVRVEMAAMRVSILRWMFTFSIAGLGIILSVMGLMFHAARLF